MAGVIRRPIRVVVGRLVGIDGPALAGVRIDVRLRGPVIGLCTVRIRLHVRGDISPIAAGVAAHAVAALRHSDGAHCDKRDDRVFHLHVHSPPVGRQSRAAGREALPRPGLHQATSASHDRDANVPCLSWLKRFPFRRVLALATWLGLTETGIPDAVFLGPADAPRCDAQPLLTRANQPDSGVTDRQKRETDQQEERQRERCLSRSMVKHHFRCFASSAPFVFLGKSEVQLFDGLIMGGV